MRSHDDEEAILGGDYAVLSSDLERGAPDDQNWVRKDGVAHCYLQFPGWSDCNTIPGLEINVQLFWHSKVVSVMVVKRSSFHLREGMRIKVAGRNRSRAAIPLLDMRVGC
jgi:hypothetical protein